MSLAGLEIVTSTYCPVPHQIRFPKKGPYWKRRNKKMQCDPRNYSEPQFFLIDDKVICCHPSLVQTLMNDLCKYRWKRK